MVEVSALDRPSDTTGDGLVRWQRVGGAVWREVRAGVLVLAPGQPDPVMLSGTGVMVWDLLAEPASLDELAAAIAGLQAVEPATVLEPLATLLGQLRELGLASAPSALPAG
ncbi:MAG TPA: PqqD family protein [Acidimicrobiales bacterium]|nr:PqqD family protein [Acidimicrobiales bacterium]